MRTRYKKAVDERHGDNFHGRTYHSAIAFIESFFAIADSRKLEQGHE